jgi:hypothetical protein
VAAEVAVEAEEVEEEAWRTCLGIMTLTYNLMVDLRSSSQ